MNDWQHDCLDSQKNILYYQLYYQLKDRVFVSGLRHCEAEYYSNNYYSPLFELKKSVLQVINIELYNE